MMCVSSCVEVSRQLLRSGLSPAAASSMAQTQDLRLLACKHFLRAEMSIYSQKDEVTRNESFNLLM